MSNYYSASRIISALIIASGVCVLCGWAFDIDNLKSFFPGYIQMRVNTATCFILSGLALWMVNNDAVRNKKSISYYVAVTLSVLIFLFSFLSYIQFIFAIDTGVDLLIMGEKSLAKPNGLNPGRMSPIPAMNFMLTGISFFIIALRPDKFRIYRALAFIVLFGSLFAVSVYLYHSASYIQDPDFTSIALNTGLTFILLSSGILLVQPRKGIIAVLSGRGFTGVIAWQILPFVIIIPLVIGIIWLEGLKANWDITQSGTMIFALLFFVVLVALVLGNIAYIMSIEKKFKVHEQSAYIASIVDFSDDAIISKSLDGIIQSWNRGAENVFGYTAEEAIGQDVSLFVPRELLAEEKKIMEEIRNGQVIEHFETKRRRKDGKIIHISLTVSPLRDKTGTIIGASKISRDITDRKVIETELHKRSEYVEGRINEIVDVLLNFTQMDFTKKIAITDKGDELDAIGVGINSLYEELESYIEQIKESNEQIETIFRYAPDAIVVIDEEGRIEQWNPKAELIFGWKESEVSGQLLHELIIPPQHHAALQQGMIHFLKTGDSSVLNKPVEMPALRKGGKLFDAELSISPSLIKGRHFFIGIINDITERKNAEETRKRYIEQLAQNKELESFAYIVSHDLKTPLQGVAKIADWLVKDYDDKLDDTGRQYLELLKNRVVRMEALINGILAYSRAGRHEEDKIEINFNELIADIEDIMSLPENARITIANPLPTLVSSKSAMTQVFGNLIGNAINHNDKEIPEVEVGVTEEERSWKFFVKDNGPGIEKEYHEKVFKVFQTLKPKDSKSSTGIGLGIVKKIIEKEGGTIWIESKTGEGSTFYFTISKQDS